MKKSASITAGIDRAGGRSRPEIRGDQETLKTNLK